MRKFNLKRLYFHFSELEGFLHKVGIIHLDVKPSNCLVDADRNILKICDFGMSLVPGEAAFLQGHGGPYEGPFCTGAYRAPELWVQKTPRSALAAPADIFSFGAVVFEVHAKENLLLHFAPEDGGLK